MEEDEEGVWSEVLRDQKEGFHVYRHHETPLSNYQTITVTCYSSIFLEVPVARLSLNGFYVGILAFCFSLLTVKYLFRFNIYVLFFKVKKETNKLN